MYQVQTQPRWIKTQHVNQTASELLECVFFHLKNCYPSPYLTWGSWSVAFGWLLVRELCIDVRAAHHELLHAEQTMTTNDWIPNLAHLLWARFRWFKALHTPWTVWEPVCYVLTHVSPLCANSLFLCGGLRHVWFVCGGKGVGLPSMMKATVNLQL